MITTNHDNDGENMDFHEEFDLSPHLSLVKRLALIFPFLTFENVLMSKHKLGPSAISYEVDKSFNWLKILFSAPLILQDIIVKVLLSVTLYGIAIIFLQIWNSTGITAFAAVSCVFSFLLFIFILSLRIHLNKINVEPQFITISEAQESIDNFLRYIYSSDMFVVAKNSFVLDPDFLGIETADSLLAHINSEHISPSEINFDEISREEILAALGYIHSDANSTGRDDSDIGDISGADDNDSLEVHDFLEEDYNHEIRQDTFNYFSSTEDNAPQSNVKQARPDILEYQQRLKDILDFEISRPAV
jgi:hypothetical protein